MSAALVEFQFFWKEWYKLVPEYSFVETEPLYTGGSRYRLNTFCMGPLQFRWYSYYAPGNK